MEAKGENGKEQEAEEAGRGIGKRMSYTSGCVEDVILSHNGTSGPKSKTTCMFRRVRQTAALEAKLLSVYNAAIYDFRPVVFSFSLTFCFFFWFRTV